MYSDPIGVSILTNGARLDRLRACVDSLLSNCYYRPLVVAVFDNGSTDGTWDYLRGLGERADYGVKWRVRSQPEDLGCAMGTNFSIQMVEDCKYVLHLESDFEHIRPELSGEDRLWLRRAVELMETGECDYLYLRRMAEEKDIFAHWWSQWMPRIDLEKGRHMRCPGFWWSNNPSLFRLEALRKAGTLPLDASKDGAKGTPGWSSPEMSAPRPPGAWLHKWGLFVHEMPAGLAGSACGVDARFGCKYGFFRDGTGPFCDACDRAKGRGDMDEHARRFAGRAVG